jgi:CubicO group peptidase (beta-lactamase class C family)
MTLVPAILVVLLVFGLSRPVTVAQVETPAASPEAVALGSPEAAPSGDLAGVVPLPLTSGRRAEFEASIADAMNRFGVPGASVAVVQGGDVVYLQGFGVTKVGGTTPVTPDTLMEIGSTTKAMTSMMAATVVDDGLMAWDTPLVDLLPNFAVADPELTPRLTVADAFCACTGVPLRTWNLFFTFDTLTPERIIASVADIPLTAPYGEQFQYSNQMFSTGGYAATVAAGGAMHALEHGYHLAMTDRILDPIGMTHSAFTLERVLGNGDYAHPHGGDLAGQTRPVPIMLDARFVEVAGGPAGALWSSARDMARYVQTQLADGVTADGTQVVSAENLERTRTPGVAMNLPAGTPTLLADASQYYGLGWEIGTYKGQPLVSHGGGTFGFISQVAYLPEADLGVVILTNGGPGAPALTYDVQFRLFELLFDQQTESRALADLIFAAQTDRLETLRAQTVPLDSATVASFDGRYTNPVLGEIVLALHNDRLVLESGALRSELWPQADETGEVDAYIFADPPLASFSFSVALRLGADGQEEVALTMPGESEPYVFSQLAAGIVATPAA